MESYPVKYPLRVLRGGKEARERFTQAMAERYQVTIAEAMATLSVTHVGPHICPCLGCRKRREWHRK